MKQPEYTVIVDSDEKTPWVFPDVPNIRQKLPTGDYSIVGLESVVTIERKSLKDFVNTVIHNDARFTAELQRMQTFEHVIIVVESSPDAVMRRAYGTGTHPHSVLGKMLEIVMGWGIDVHWWGSRQGANWLAGKWLERVWTAVGKTANEPWGI